MGADLTEGMHVPHGTLSCTCCSVETFSSGPEADQRATARQDTVPGGGAELQ